MSYKHIRMNISPELYQPDGAEGYLAEQVGKRTLFLSLHNLRIILFMFLLSR